MLQDIQLMANDAPGAATPLDALLREGLHGAAIVALLDHATARWHLPEHGLASTEPLLALHRSNFDLWHLEDTARDPSATAEQIAAVKRAIDRTNQQRNDHVEAIDTALLNTTACRDDSPLHSETPGQMLDRLSILSLKVFHTAEETHRPSAAAEHRERNAQRLVVLRQQMLDLAGCLAELWDAVLSGERRFKLYRQFKMYNDPDLNPVLYRGSL